jgi:chitinase
MPTPTMSPTPTEEAVGKRIIGYYPAWTIYERQFYVKHLDNSGAAAQLTHINYAFGNVVDNRCLTGVTQPGVGDAFADYQKNFAAAQSVDGVGDEQSQPLKGNYNQLRKLKARHPHPKIFICADRTTNDSLLNTLQQHLNP